MVSSKPPVDPGSAPEPRPSLIARYLADREMTPEDRRAVLEDLFVFGKANQTPFLVQMAVLLVLSTVIATAGLLADSAAVVIGAMLVAPLMNPVMAAAGAVVMGWSRRFYVSMWQVGAMGAGALALSSLITALSPELVFMPEQVLARTRPTYFDLLIALAAGSAGAYTITRKYSSAIPGVAVAVALLPPLASAGVLFTSGEAELGVRAVVLFLTNLVAMVLAGALTFIAVGVYPTASRKQSAAFIRSKIWLFSLLTVAICIPLWFYSNKVLFNAHYRAAKSEILQQWLRENELQLADVDLSYETATVTLHLEGPNPPINLGVLHQRVADSLARRGEDSDFTILYTWTQKIIGKWPPDEVSLAAAAGAREQDMSGLVGREWRWTMTQQPGLHAIRPGEEERYVLVFDQRGEFELRAPCGNLKGTYNLRRQSIDLSMNRNWFSKCREDDALLLFSGALSRARTAYLEEGSLRISLSGDEGVMFFEQL